MQMHILSFPRTPSARALRGGVAGRTPHSCLIHEAAAHQFCRRLISVVTPLIFSHVEAVAASACRVSTVAHHRLLHPSCSWGELRDTAMGMFFCFFFKDISALCDVTCDGTEIAILKRLFLLIKKKKHLRPFFPFPFPPRRPRLKASSHDDNDIRPLTAASLTGNRMAN